MFGSFYLQPQAVGVGVRGRKRWRGGRERETAPGAGRERTRVLGQQIANKIRLTFSELAHHLNHDDR